MVRAKAAKRLVDSPLRLAIVKILIADKIADSGVAQLRGIGHDIELLPKGSGDDLLEAFARTRPSVLVVRSTRVTGEMMDADPDLELIVRAGAGFDTIDVEAASSRGIFVANCPGKNSDAVAELTVGLMLSLDRRIPDNVRDARIGRWNKAEYSKARGLKGNTLGVVGIGSIGTRVALAGKSLGMRVIAWSRSLTDGRATELEIDRKASPVDVAAEADVVTLHVAATPDTHHLADRTFFDAMRPGTHFINTTRGSVVDEDALLWAMEEKDILAAVDVLEEEPDQKEGTYSHRLAEHPNLYMTHHIGASTLQAQEATAADAVRIITSYDETGEVPNCVNLEEHSPATHLLTVRHLDKIGVLSAVLNEVRMAEWNVQEMENLIFEGAKAACARIRFNGRPRDEVVKRIEDHPDVLAVTLISL